MGTITSSVGLISGINTGAIVDQLIAIEQQPVTKLQAQLATNTATKSAFTTLSGQLGSLQTIGKALERPLTFGAASATSSDENVLTATASAGASTGSFQFKVAQLVTSQQSVSNGFASQDSLVGAGNITVTLGGGNLKSQTTLAQLNGGTGVPQGQFRITDRSGKSAVIDATSAITLDDVVQKINNALDINVRASIQNNKLVLADQSGQTAANLTVSNVGDSTTADALGITGSVAGGTLTGANLSKIGAGTALSGLNDGLGVSTAAGAADFEVTVGDGSKIDITLGSSQTVGDVVKAINTAGGSKLKASINTSNNSIDLTDTSGGGGTFKVAALNNSSAAHDLGIDQTGSGGLISGGSVLAGVDSVLVSKLHGGSGVPLGQISITDRNGTNTTVDLSQAKTVQDVLDTINNTAGIGVTASLNSSGNGIQLADKTGGGGNLVVADVNSTTAASLGIAGTFDTSKTTVNGGDLHVQFVSAGSTLAQYNGGAGVTPGQFKITAANGATATIDTSVGTFKTLGDVISAINAKNLGVVASINSNGNGLLLTDNTNGAGKLTVKDVGNTTAASLGIAGTATTNTIDGSLQKTIAVTATDTLSTVQQKIRALGFGASASLVDDGSGQNSQHISFTAFNSGVAGQVVIDGGATSLTSQTLVQAQNAAVFFGGGTNAKSLLITSDTNQIANVVPGVSIQLHGVSTSPVTLSVTKDPSSIVTQLQSFTTTFNAVVTQLASLTKFDTTSNQGGLLLGDSTAQEIQSQLYVALQGSVTGAGKYHTLADLGITVGDNAQVTFDPTKFQSAFASDPTSVQNFFTQTTTGIGALIDKSLTKLVDPVSGVITLENKTLDNQSTETQSRITELNTLIADKKTRLTQQFANMESVLASLQSQQSALSSLTGITPTSSSSTKSSSAA